MSLLVDLRSDTVTRPTPAMRDAIHRAEVGDNVLGDDPTVLALERRVAQIMGKPAACFVPTGTMANQTAIRAHTEPGDEVIAHEGSHIIHYETGSPAALSGVMIRTLSGPHGQFDAADVEAAVRPRSIHFPNSALLLVENTHNRGGGSVWALDRIKAVTQAAREHGLKLHLDGARIWNACAYSGLAPEEFAGHFDTVSCCFSKGLGAPVGSAVAGDEPTIARVARFRKMFGGTMRQSGILAAAALFALDHHRDRLVEDHQNAALLSGALGEIRGVTIPHPVQTNIVLFDLDPSLGTASDVCAKLRERGVWVLANAPRRVRAVCHLDAPRALIEQAIPVFRQVLRS